MEREPEIKIKTLDGVLIPQYATEGSAGFDLIAHSFKKLYKGDREVSMSDKLTNSIDKGFIKLRPYERVLVGTGLFIEIPEGFEMQIRPRSGMALKRGLTVFNSPGTIDSDYRGEVGVILYNSTQFLCEVKLGEAIAQGVIAPVVKGKLVRLIGDLSETIRGEGGFGSTDVTKVNTGDKELTL